MDETRLFLVRVWQQAAQFRASVRPVDDEEQQFFTTPDALGAYLARHAAPASPPARRARVAGGSAA